MPPRARSPGARRRVPRNSAAVRSFVVWWRVVVGMSEVYCSCGGIDDGSIMIGCSRPRRYCLADRDRPDGSREW